jgi:hypothetical protein
MLQACNTNGKQIQAYKADYYHIIIIIIIGSTAYYRPSQPPQLCFSIGVALVPYFSILGFQELAELVPHCQATSLEAFLFSFPVLLNVTFLHGSVSFARYRCPSHLSLTAFINYHIRVTH